MNVIWEIDFYSRPILDENGKKKWELLVCESAVDPRQDSDRLYKYSAFCPSTSVNFQWLAENLQKAIANAPEPPQRIRFFRQQMNNTIVKACQDIGIPASPSRRTIALQAWLTQRNAEVYPQDPNYQSGENLSIQMRFDPAQPLPDALTGDKWAIVTIPASELLDLAQWPIDFREAFPFSFTKITPETVVPGIVIFSSRALPIAGWMSGIEVATVRYEPAPLARLILDTGASDSWVLGRLNDSQRQEEAANFESQKEVADGVHFLAIQTDPSAANFAGFWLLLDRSKMSSNRSVCLSLPG